MSDKPIRVLLVDDHPVWRDGLAALLATMPDIEVVGTAGDGATAIAEAAELQPDVVAMDIHMPSGMDGVEATRRITAEHPHIAVIALTMVDDDATLFAAMRAGAIGYLLKGAGKAEIVRAIIAAANGEAIFGPVIARRLTSFFAAAPRAGSLAFPQLTPREREVLNLIAAGLSNPQIVSRLTLSPQTVRNLVSNVFAKLHVVDRAEAIIRAREAGLGR